MVLFAGSTATGQLIFRPAAAWLIEHFGWRYAVIPVVGASVAVGLLATLFMRDHPGDGTGAGSTASGSTAQLLGPFTSLAQITRNRTFWILACGFFICRLRTNGLVQTHFISLCRDNGLSSVPAASVLAMIGGAFDLVGTTLSGYLFDRYDNGSCYSGITPCAACRPSTWETGCGGPGSLAPCVGRQSIVFPGRTAGDLVRALAWLGPEKAGEALRAKLPWAEMTEVASARARLPTWMAQGVSALVSHG